MKNISVTASAHPQNKDITLLSVKGFIDTTTAPEFEKTFQLVLSENKYKLVVDLKEVNYISSVGWGIFVGEIKRIRNQKGDLFFASMSPEVADAYELLQFSTIFKAFPTVEQAIKSGFGKATAAKVPVSTRTEKNLEAFPVKKGLGETPANIRFDETPSANGSKKLPILLRIFLPWKWF